MTLHILPIVLAALTTASHPAPSNLGFQAPRQVFNGTVAQGAWLRIRNHKGDIEVRETSGRNVIVTADRTGWSDYDNVTFEVKRDGPNVTICTIWPGTSRCDASGYSYDSDSRYGRERRTGDVDFVVQLPRGVKLVAATGNGEVDIRNAGAEVVAASGNGEVSVRGADGPVKASSGNGEVTIEGARGEVEASSGNGEINVSTSAGPVSARTGNGSIEVDMASLRGNDDMDFATGNGSIDVSFPSNLSANIEANVPTRNFETEFAIEMAARWSTRHIEGKIGNGGRRIRLSTGNGHVRIRKTG